MVEPSLTPEERRGLGIAALTALVTGIVGGAVAWGFEEAKAHVSRRREVKSKPPEPPLVTLE